MQASADKTSLHIGEAWRLRKISCGVAREAWCELRRHSLGWELLLFVDAIYNQIVNDPTLVIEQKCVLTHAALELVDVIS